jgi:hypothetical protein
MSGPFDFSDPPPGRRRERDNDRRDDRDDDERRPRRRRDEEESDRPARPRRDSGDRRESRPRPRDHGEDNRPVVRNVNAVAARPGSISFAGIVWIIFGVLNILGGLLGLVLAIVAVAATERQDAARPEIVKGAAKERVQNAAVQQGVAGVVSLGVGALFVVFGAGALRGRARDVIAQSVTTFIVAFLYFIAFGASIIVLLRWEHGILPNSLKPSIVLSALISFVFAALMAATGMMALVGRRAYVQWVGGKRKRKAGDDGMTGDEFASSFG